MKSEVPAPSSGSLGSSLFRQPASLHTGKCSPREAGLWHGARAYWSSFPGSIVNGEKVSALLNRPENEPRLPEFSETVMLALLGSFGLKIFSELPFSFLN